MKKRKICKIPISDRELDLPKSQFVKIMEIARESKDVISLGPGEPDFETPKHIKEYAKKMLDKGETHYTSIAGISEVREAFAKKVKKDNKIDVDPDDICVTTGSTEGLFLCLASLLDPGESVLTPDPGFLAYIPMISSLNGNPISLLLNPENNFEYDLDQIKKKITKKTTALILNSPGNPTGTVFSKKKLEEIADFAMDNCLIVMSDEAYEKLVYDKPHISIGSLNGMEDNVVSFFSFSKSHAMCGFRVGFAAGPSDIIKSMVRLKIGTTLSTPTISQLAAKYALESTQKPAQEMIKKYRKRRDLIYKRTLEIGLKCQKPEGAFYLFPSIKSTGMSSIELSKYLLEKAKVLVVPGIEFGKGGEGFVRMSYATEYSKIETAMDRIEKAVNLL